MLLSRQGFKFFAYISISALISLTMWMLILLPEFLVNQKWSDQKIGWVIGIFFIVSLFSRIFAGHLADNIGNVPTALIGVVVSIGGCAFYWLSLHWPDTLFIARALHGAGTALVSGGALFHLVQSVPQEIKGRVMGYFGLPGFIMMAVGPFFAEALRTFWGMKGMYTVILLNFLVIGFILKRLPRPLAPRGTRRATFIHAFKRNFPSLKPVIFFAFCFSLGFSSWNSFLAPTVSWLGTGAVSAFGVGYGVGALTTRLGLSQWLDTGKKRLISISSLIFYGGGLALIPHASYVWHLGLIGFLCGMSHGIYYPALSSIAAERFHPLHTSNAMSLYLSAGNIGMFLGPPLWGFIGDRAGTIWIFAFAGSLVFISTLIFVVTHSWPPAHKIFWAMPRRLNRNL